ncbi:MAG: signal peptidase II [Patescibacteria group bacterium]|jgi:signal peptidase II
METKDRRRWLIIHAVLFFVVLIDRALRVISLQIDGTHEIIPKVLSFVYVRNSGVALSIPLSNVLAIIFSAVVIAGVAFVWLKSYQQGRLTQAAAAAMVVFGALSNLIDRIMHGAVVDYLDFFSWSTINTGDILIFCGAVLMGISILFPRTR